MSNSKKPKSNNKVSRQTEKPRFSRRGFFVVPVRLEFRAAEAVVVVVYTLILGAAAQSAANKSKSATNCGTTALGVIASKDCSGKHTNANTNNSVTHQATCKLLVGFALGIPLTVSLGRSLSHARRHHGGTRESGCGEHCRHKKFAN
jgi:hypothetical protein